MLGEEATHWTHMALEQAPHTTPCCCGPRQQLRHWKRVQVLHMAEKPLAMGVEQACVRVRVRRVRVSSV